MDLTGEYRIPAPRETVWAALNNPDILKACIPGCEELNKTSDTELVAKVVAKIGPVKAAFGGKVTLSDLDPPNGYTITGEGQGGAAGFAKGGAKVRLEPADGGAATVLRYAADAQIGGKLAQIGSRLVEGTAKKLADEFFAAFVAQAAVAAQGCFSRLRSSCIYFTPRLKAVCFASFCESTTSSNSSSSICNLFSFSSRIPSSSAV